MRLRPRSILIGAVVDKLVFIPCAFALVATLGTGSLRFQLAALVVGSGATGIGGYVGARHARRQPIAHGLAIAGVAFLLSLARFLASAAASDVDNPAAHPLWWEFVAWALTLGAGLLGGWFAAARPR